MAAKPPPAPDSMGLFFPGLAIQRKASVSWREFCETKYHLPFSFAAHHEEIWEWGESLQNTEYSDPLVVDLARGGGKSTTAQGVLARLEETKARDFGFYISATQVQANRHLAEIARAFEQNGIDRALTTYGFSKGWNASMLNTASGMSVVAVGLDTASRGIKIENKRPSFYVLDDLDELHDTLETTAKKIETISKSLLPAMAPNGAVIYLQNAMIPTGIMSSFHNGTNTFLLGAKVIGPVPAAYGLVYERDGSQPGTGAPKYKVLGGVPTWEGQSLQVIEQQINLWGLRAFLEESQHEVYDNRVGALWNRLTIYGNDELDDQGRKKNPGCQILKCPPLKYIAVGVDPAGNSDPAKSDRMGIIVVGLGRDNHCYVLRDYSGHYTPAQGIAVLAKLFSRGVNAFVVEKNYGGHWVVDWIKTISKDMPVFDVSVSQAKEVRAEPTSVWYSDGRFHHVLDADEKTGAITNNLEQLEREMLTWVPDGKSKSPNRIDALVLAHAHLVPMVEANPRIVERWVAPPARI